jgi:hypothetical protein
MIRRRWRGLSVTAVFTLLSVNVYVHEGLFPLLIIAGAGAGALLLVAVEFLGSGYAVAYHAKTEQQRIAEIHAARRQKELTR